MIRRATEEDIEFIVEMGRKFYESCGFPSILTFDPEILTGVLHNLIVNDNACILVDDKLRGMIAGVVYPYYFTGQMSGNEMFWWVEPEHRKGLGKKLLDKLEEWAEAKGAVSFTMISLDASNPEKMDKIYRKRGYEPREHHYVRYL